MLLFSSAMLSAPQSEYFPDQFLFSKKNCSLSTLSTTSEYSSAHSESFSQLPQFEKNLRESSNVSVSNESIVEVMRGEGNLTSLVCSFCTCQFMSNVKPN